MKAIRATQQTQIIMVSMLHIRSTVTAIYNAHEMLWFPEIVRLDYSGIVRKVTMGHATGQLTSNAMVQQLNAQQLKPQQPQELQ